MDYERIHEMTGIPLEKLKEMSWYEIEKALGFKVEEPPYEIKREIKNLWAREFRWVTSEEVEELRREVERIIQKYS